jgi:hypothetical protein
MRHPSLTIVLRVFAVLAGAAMILIVQGCQGPKAKEGPGLRDQTALAAEEAFRSLDAQLTQVSKNQNKPHPFANDLRMAVLAYEKVAPIRIVEKTTQIIGNQNGRFGLDPKTIEQISEGYGNPPARLEEDAAIAVRKVLRDAYSNVQEFSDIQLRTLCNEIGVKEISRLLVPEVKEALRSKAKEKELALDAFLIVEVAPRQVSESGREMEARVTVKFVDLRPKATTLNSEATSDRRITWTFEGEPVEDTRYANDALLDWGPDRGYTPGTSGHIPTPASTTSEGRTRAEAIQISIGGTRKGYVGIKGESQWYTFVASRDENVVLRLENMAPTGTYRAGLKAFLTNDDEVVTASTIEIVPQKNTKNQSKAAPLLANQRYYVHVKANDRDPANRIDYSISVLKN